MRGLSPVALALQAKLQEFGTALVKHKPRPPGKPATPATSESEAGPAHLTATNSDAPALEHFIFKRTLAKGPYVKMCNVALDAIRAAAASSGWGFSLDDWIAVLRAPKEKKLPAKSLDRLIRIATVSYKPAPGDAQPAAAEAAATGKATGGAAAAAAAIPTAGPASSGGSRAGGGSSDGHGNAIAPASDVLLVGVAGGNQYTVVDNPVRLRLALDAMEGAGAVAVDLEGVNLGGSKEAGGYITTIQLCRECRGLVYIIDLLSLGNEAAFTGSVRQLCPPSTCLKHSRSLTSDTPTTEGTANGDRRAKHPIRILSRGGAVAGLC